MKKLLVLTLTLLLPLAIFAQGNKANKTNKWQQNLERRNEQTIQHLQMLGHSYNRIEKAEVKERIAQNIDMEIEHWYMENMETINRVQQEEGKPDGDLDKQQLAAEVKAGRIPEIMYKTVPEQTAMQLKRRAEMRREGKTKTSKSSGKGLKSFKK